jgi:hypothetical protein
VSPSRTGGCPKPDQRLSFIFALAVCIWENQTRTRLARNAARVILSEAKDLTDLLAIAQLVACHYIICEIPRLRSR